MDAIKSIARRTTQSLREMVSSKEVSDEEVRLNDATNKVRTLGATSETICQKVIHAAKLMEQLGLTLREIGEAYKETPDLAPEAKKLADDVYDVGIKLVETSQEHQKGLKENGFELLHKFNKDCATLKEVEAERRHHELEYDFFKSKVLDLRSAPQKDFTRLPRNEQTMESWRVELWRVTEANKALCSKLYLDGRKAIDKSVLTTVQVLRSFVEIASAGFSQTFQGARLPSYSADPLLPPSPLPPNPMPPSASPYSSLGAWGAGAPPAASAPATVATTTPATTAYQAPSMPVSSFGGPTGAFPSPSTQPSVIPTPSLQGYQPPPVTTSGAPNPPRTTYAPPPLG